MDNENREPYLHPFARMINALMTQRALVLGLILVVALIGFEIFNYSTTEYALVDLLGDMRFAGIRWATILSLAFCGIDFAGIARLFTPEEPGDNTKEMWFLFAAWLLAATLNALLTWWGVSMALNGRTPESTAIVDQGILAHIVPIFVSCVVWVTRILLISNLSSFGARYFGQVEAQPVERESYRPEAPQYSRSRPANPGTTSRPANSGTTSRPAVGNTASRPTPSGNPARPATNGNHPRPAAPSYNAQPARGDTTPRPPADNRTGDIPAPRPSPSTPASRPAPASGSTRPQTGAPGRTPAPPPPSRPAQNRPQPKLQPAPKPVEPEPEPEEPAPPEPEYIPDEDSNYGPYTPPAYHSLSARANRGNGNENGNRRS